MRKAFKNIFLNEMHEGNKSDHMFLLEPLKKSTQEI